MPVAKRHGGSACRAMAVYGAGSWVILQVVDVLAQNIGLPSWVFPHALTLLLVGLPIVGATAYLNGLGKKASMFVEC